MLACLVALAACAELPGAGQPTSRAVTGELPDVSSVAFPRRVRDTGVARSNRHLAQDFLDLTFELESGEPLRGLLRHEGPVRVFVRAPGLGPYRRDLENLLARLRAEARIDIRSTDDPAAAQIHIDGVSQRELQRVDPGAACFIVPGETSWDAFRRRANRDRLRWSEQRTLGRTAIFIPVDTFPQDIRDCLHEELGQALGPANDLYRLPDTVFNDDNFHGILTPFDMLMLRALYDPALNSGQPRQVVAARIGPILARINPRGEGIGAPPRAAAEPEWKRQIERALTRGNATATRRAAAGRAVDMARAMQPVDHRLGVALIARGRLWREGDPGAAARDFLEAEQLFRRQLGVQDVRTAQATLHVALLALEAGNADAAATLSERAIPAARRAENAVLLSSLLAVKAAALAAQGDLTAARTAQLDHLRWARYAYGDASGERTRAQARLENLAFGPARAIN